MGCVGGDGSILILPSSDWLPLFQASEKMELTTLWERTWPEEVVSETPLSDWLEWLDWDSGRLEELEPDLILELDKDDQSWAASVRFIASW